MSYDSELKRAVAQAILEPKGGFVFNTIPGSFDVLDIEVHRLSTLESQVRVKTRSMGTHYFNVQVKGML